MSNDLYVHAAMKKCCVKVLEEIDKKKKDVKGSGLYGMTLAKELGKQPIPEARKALRSTVGASAVGGENAELGEKRRDLCVKLARKHEEKHKDKGEAKEGEFWGELAEALGGGELGKVEESEGGSTEAGKTQKTTGETIAEKAKEKVAEYKKKGITYSQSGKAGTADCSHFVHDVYQSAGVDVPYTTSGGFADSPHFEPTTTPQPGDVIWQPGHVGIYMGTNENGQPMGAQMGNSGAAIGPWGKGGWFEGGEQVTFYHPKGLP